jgi:hypothetical protein
MSERESCLEVTKGCDWVFNFAADMGGMGYIQSNQAYILYNNTMITFNMAEAARLNGVKRYSCALASFIVTTMSSANARTRVSCVRVCVRVYVRVSCGNVRYLFTSSACVYPEHKQETEDNPGLRCGRAAHTE